MLIASTYGYPHLYFNLNRIKKIKIGIEIKINNPNFFLIYLLCKRRFLASSSQKLVKTGFKQEISKN